MQKTPIFVGAIIKNSKDEFLLQKRDGKPILFPNRWTLFGGKVEKGEHPKIAILRELKEEIGLQKSQIKSIKKLKTYTQEGGARQVIFEILTNAKLKKLKLKEGEKMEFITQKNLFKRKFAFNIQEVLKGYLLPKD